MTGADIRNSVMHSAVSSYNGSALQKQNDAILRETQQYIKTQVEEQKRQMIYRQQEQEFAQTYLLPSLLGKEGATAYYSAFQSLSKLNPEDYSLADATFFVENAFYNNDKNFQNTYQNYIQKATNIIRNQISKKGIDDEDNTSKNLTLFQYFAGDTKQNGKVVHKAIKYDFDDYWGSKDYSKMFVSKLMRTNTGQCHSMPLLYLILAEQIGAEASLVMSPNHSYIRFEDNDGEMLNVELTNGMFTANSFVLNNGYIKSEALQNKLYMQNLTKKELLSQTFVDLASGYIHKFGYDEFVGKILDKAQELNPNNINAVLWESNLNQERFVKACNRLGINPHDKEDLQKIKNYPNLGLQLRNINGQFDHIDNSGFSQMPPEQYEKWLGSLQKAENKQRSDEILERIKAIEAQKRKEAQKRQLQEKNKKVTPKKEAPKTYLIPILT
ncbi:MAG: hypothetical protein QM564_06900 [Bergeyella sp.]